MLDPVAKLHRARGAAAACRVAFSGGVDSTVLAHLLVKQRRKLGGLRLVHVDHGLQAASAEWSGHCARQARAWRVPFVLLQASIERSRGESPEAAARDARYALLGEALEPGEVLVTAQHRDDQVETLLLQLFRGAGVAGLAAMPAMPRSAAGRIVRPLLECLAREIEASREGAAALGRRPLATRHPFRPQLPAPSTAAADPRALARSRRGDRAQRAHMAEAAHAARRSRGATSPASPMATGLTSASLRALPVAPAQRAACLHCARRPRAADGRADGDRRRAARRARRCAAGSELADARIDSPPAGRLELQKDREVPHEFVGNHGTGRTTAVSSRRWCSLDAGR